MQIILAHPSNYTKGRWQEVEYIVLHYTANDGDTDTGNANYFTRPNIGASAHYFTDEDSFTQSVADEDTAFAVGAKTYKHPYCRNGNSISIEMCSDKVDGKYVITEKTMLNALKLTKELMKKYNIPIENVLRHHDVTGKNCPEPWVRDESLWHEFKSKLQEQEVEEVEKRYNNIGEVPSWAVPTIQKLIKKGAFADTESLDLSMDMIRLFVINDRVGSECKCEK